MKDCGMPSLPAEIVKVMPPRGPLQQYRVDKACQFDCFRCGGRKTSKLITVLGENDDQLLCNGCYGRLVSLWELKSGELTEEERSEAILALVGRYVTPAQIEAARVRLARGVLFRQLSEPAQKALATAEAVTNSLRAATGLDWSAAVVCLCKAVEIEAVQRIAVPLQGASRDLDLSADLQDKDLARLARFCVGRAPAPELGSLAYSLRVAGSSRRRASTSRLLQVLLAFTATVRAGDWLLSANGFPEVLDNLSKNFRNPAAHTRVLDEKDYDACFDVVLGEGGLLPALVSATARI